MGQLPFYKDGLYKDIREDEAKSLVMAVWDSPAIDVSPALSIIGEINSGMMGSYMKPLDGNEIELLVSLDGSNYSKLKNGYIENAVALNDNPSLWLRAIIRSYVASISRDFSPRLYVITIVLSNKKQETWETEVRIPLEWGDN